MKCRISLLAIVMLSAAVVTSAQGGSNFSALGIGDIRYSVGAMYDAMSGTQIAMPTRYGINVINPAMLGIATTTRIQAGYKFNQYVTTDDDVTSAQNNGKIDGLLAMFSVDTNYGFGISFGILPYSTLNYSTSRNIQAELDGEQIIGRSSQLGKGGSSQLLLGSSVRVLDNLQIGLSASGLFGILDYTDQVVLNGNYWAVTNKRLYDVRGLLFRGGVWWKPLKWFNVGAFASAGAGASVYTTRQATGINSAGVYYDTLQYDTSSSGLPVMAGLGFSVQSGKKLVGLDFIYGDYTGLNINGRNDAQYSTMYRASVGFSSPGEMSSISTFFDNIGYYFGASVEKLYITFNGYDLNEYAGSFGISFPLGGHAMVDAAVQAGWRGTRIDSYLSEQFAKLTVTVSIGETWFKPFARD